MTALLTALRRPNPVQLGLAAALIAGFGLAWRFHGAFQPANLVAMLNRQPLAPLLFILLHILASLFFVPRTLLAVAAGLVWGVWWGSLWTMAGALAGSLAGFLIARYLAAGRQQPGGNLASMTSGKLERLVQRLERGGWRSVALVRLVPIMPHTPVNYAFGLTGIGIGSYLLGSAVGLAPMTVFSVDLGAAGRTALAADPGAPGRWLEPSCIGLAALAASLAVPRILSGVRDRRASR